jgi:predicted RNA-binding Zn ribbon-like protein
MSPETLIGLANLGRPRRPGGTRMPFADAVLPDAATATRQLGSLIPRPVTAADLDGVRQVRTAAAGAAAALLGGATPDSGTLSVLNRLARGAAAHIELVVSEGTLARHLVWDDTSVAAHLARTVIDELASLDPARLRECARSACDLLFYDTTRSRTRRWHAEDPCGWRERQQARRALPQAPEPEAIHTQANAALGDLETEIH